MPDPEVFKIPKCEVCDREATSLTRDIIQHEVVGMLGRIVQTPSKMARWRCNEHFLPSERLLGPPLTKEQAGL